jgi:DNA-binding response OmpR family regulator
MNQKDAWAWIGESNFAPEQLPQKLRERTKRKNEKQAAALPFQIVLGGKSIALEPIEYRLVLFLASRPYHAFTKKEIFEGIRGFFDVEIDSEETIPTSIRSLRDKLGFFRDFVQTVPHIGYRFKP